MPEKISEQPAEKNGKTAEQKKAGAFLDSLKTPLASEDDIVNKKIHYREVLENTNALNDNELKTIISDSLDKIVLDDFDRITVENILKEKIKAQEFSAKQINDGLFKKKLMAILVENALKELEEKKQINEPKPLSADETVNYGKEILYLVKTNVEFGNIELSANDEEYIKEKITAELEKIKIAEKDKREHKFIGEIVNSALDGYHKRASEKLGENLLREKEKAESDAKNIEPLAKEIKMEDSKEKPKEEIGAGKKDKAELGATNTEPNIEKTKTPENAMDEKRYGYVEAYKNFDRKKYKKFIGDNNLPVKNINSAFEEAKNCLATDDNDEEKQRNFIEKLNDVGLTEEIAEQMYSVETAKLEYSNEKIKYGKELKKIKSPELIKEIEKKSGKKHKNWADDSKEKIELDRRLKAELFQKLIIKENDILNQLNVENLPPGDRDLIDRWIDRWMKLSAAKRLLISTGLMTGVVAGVGGFGASAALGYAAYRGARGGASVLAGKSAGKLFEKWFDRDDRKKKFQETQEAREDELNKFNLDSLDNLKKIEEKYQKILKAKFSREKKKIIGKVITSVVAGGGTAILAGHFENIYASGAETDSAHVAIKAPNNKNIVNTGNTGAGVKEAPHSSEDFTSQSKEMTSPIMEDGIPPNCEIKISKEVESIMEDRDLKIKNGILDLGGGKKLILNGGNATIDEGITASIEILKKGNDLEIISADTDGSVDKILLDANNDIIDKVGVEVIHKPAADSSAVEVKTQSAEPEQVNISTQQKLDDAPAQSGSAANVKTEVEVKAPEAEAVKIEAGGLNKVDTLSEAVEKYLKQDGISNETKDNFIKHWLGNNTEIPNDEARKELLNKAIRKLSVGNVDMDDNIENVKNLVYKGNEVSVKPDGTVNVEQGGGIKEASKVSEETLRQNAAKIAPAYEKIIPAESAKAAPPENLPEYTKEQILQAEAKTAAKMSDIHKWKFGPFKGSEMEQWDAMRSRPAEDIINGEFGDPAGKNGLDVAEWNNRHELQNYALEAREALKEKGISLQGNETMEELANKYESFKTAHAEEMQNKIFNSGNKGIYDLIKIPADERNRIFEEYYRTIEGFNNTRDQANLARLLYNPDNKEALAGLIGEVEKNLYKSAESFINKDGDLVIRFNFKEYSVLPNDLIIGQNGKLSVDGPFWENWNLKKPVDLNKHNWEKAIEYINK